MILGILVMIWVGRKFYELAHEYDKNRWIFAILGVVSYYAGLYSGAFLIGIGLAFYAPEYLENANELLLSAMSIPFGILACWGTYKLLERSWSKPDEIGSETLDSDFLKR